MYVGRGLRPSRCQARIFNVTRCNTRPATLVVILLWPQDQNPTSDPFWVSEILTTIIYSNGEIGMVGGCHASLVMLKPHMTMNR